MKPGTKDNLRPYRPWQMGTITGWDKLAVIRWNLRRPPPPPLPPPVRLLAVEVNRATDFREASTDADPLRPETRRRKTLGRGVSGWQKSDREKYHNKVLMVFEGPKTVTVRQRINILTFLIFPKEEEETTSVEEVRNSISRFKFRHRVSGWTFLTKSARMANNRLARTTFTSRKIIAHVCPSSFLLFALSAQWMTVFRLQEPTQNHCRREWNASLRSTRKSPYRLLFTSQEVEKSCT